jgi:ABC-type transporter Mla MlaB component
MHRAEVEAMELEGSRVAMPERATTPGDTAPPPDGLGSPVGVADWRGDVALELWVEADVHPVRIRMAGRLDATTAANLDEVVRELLADGTSDFELSTDGLRVVDASAVGALADIERVIRNRGGTLHRVAPSSGPFTRSNKSAPPPPARR